MPIPIDFNPFGKPYLKKRNPILANASVYMPLNAPSTTTEGQLSLPLEFLISKGNVNDCFAKKEDVGANCFICGKDRAYSIARAVENKDLYFKPARSKLYCY